MALSMPYVMTSSLREKIHQADQTNNPYTRYIEFYTNTWTATRDWASYAYYNWVRTGNPDDLARAIAVDPPYYGTHGNYRQEAVYYIALYHLLKEHMTEERRADYEFKLKRMATSAIRQVRSWDADERITVYLMCLMMDAEFGTSYATADSTDLESPYYVEFETMQACYNLIVEAFQTDFKDGATSESTGYTVNTYNMVLFAIGCLGKNCIPGVAEWLPKFKQFMLWAFSSDLNFVMTYGDAEQSQSMEHQMCLHYRLPLIWSLIGLGEDEDGKLADLSTALLNKYKGGGNPITIPNQLHPILNIGGMFLLDPTVLPTTPRTTLEYGWKWFAPGIVIYRDVDTYLQITMTTALHDDHDFSGGFDVRLYHKGEIVLDRPGGYAVNHTLYNSGAIKGRGWFPDRGIDSVNVEADGTIVVTAHQHGPIPSYNWGGSPDYVGHEWIRTVKFNPITKEINIIDSWNTDGVFPDYTGNQYWDVLGLNSFKLFESRIYSVGTNLTNIDSILEWITPKGRKMRVAFAGVKEVVSKEIVSPFKELEFKENVFSSDSNSGQHVFKINIGEFVGPLPPPEPEPVELPEPVDLAIIDNTDIGYQFTGAWIRFAGQGRNSEVDYIAAGQGLEKAIWSAKVIPGKYRVSTTWSVLSNRATNAPYKVFLDNVLKAEKTVNQEIEPDSLQDGGINWFDLAEVEVITNGIISVELSNNADEYVIADAVRIEKIGDIIVPPPPVEELTEMKVWLRKTTEGYEIVFKIPKE